MGVFDHPHKCIGCSNWCVIRCFKRDTLQLAGADSSSVAMRCVTVSYFLVSGFRSMWGHRFGDPVADKVCELYVVTSLSTDHTTFIADAHRYRQIIGLYEAGASPSMPWMTSVESRGDLGNTQRKSRWAGAPYTWRQQCKPLSHTVAPLDIFWFF